MTERAHTIENYIKSQLEPVRVTGIAVLAADWYQFLDEPQGRYGWNYPVPVEGDTLRLIAYFCPQLMAKHIEMFDEQSSSLYVHIVTWMMQQYTILVYGGGAGINDDMTISDIQARIESELYDQSPAHLQLFSKVQLSVLDA